MRKMNRADVKQLDLALLHIVPMLSMLTKDERALVGCALMKHDMEVARA